MREARFDDLVRFSSLLSQWMCDDKNTAALQFAVNRAFELYHQDLNLARMPFGDPDSFFEVDSVCILSHFDVTSFNSLTSYLQHVQSAASSDEKKTRWVDRILNIADAKKFDLKDERWRKMEFSQKEFEILKAMLESVASERPLLIKKLLSQEDNQQHHSDFQYYMDRAEKLAAQAGNMAVQAGAVVKSALATAYCAVMDHVVHNSATEFQSHAESPGDFILQGALSAVDDCSWHEKTSVRYLGKKWPSLNMRVIDEVSRAFYNSQVLVSDASAGVEEQILPVDLSANKGASKNQQPSASRAASTAPSLVNNGSSENHRANLKDNGDDIYVLFPGADAIDDDALGQREYTAASRFVDPMQ